MSQKVKPRADTAKRQRKDTVLIHGVSEDGQTLAVLRAREDRIEAGVVRAVKEGEALQGELVKLTPRPESPLVCDVEVQVPAGAINALGGSDTTPADAGAAPLGRPAQVATDTYRDGWDAIWSRPRTGKKALSN